MSVHRHCVYVCEPTFSSVRTMLRNSSHDPEKLIQRRTYVNDHNALNGKNCLRKYAALHVAYRVYRIDPITRCHTTIFEGVLRHV